MTRSNTGIQKMGSRYFALYVLAGAVLGFCAANFLPTWHWLDNTTLLAKTIYLNSLKMVVVPLILFSLLSGVLNLRKSNSLSSIGGLTVLYYFTTTAIAIFIGLFIVLGVNPWTDIAPIEVAPAQGVQLIAATDGSLTTIIHNLLDKMFTNPFTALSQYNILGILTFAILFGLGLAASLPDDSSLPSLIEQISGGIFTITGWVIRLLPIGIFAITYQLAGDINAETLMALGELAVVVLLATLFHGLVVLPLLAWLFTGIRPLPLLAKLSQPMITALSTSSSAATLPVSMETAAREFKINPDVSSVVLPLGATVNMDGTALFEGIAAVFLAQMFGIPLDAFTIITIFLVAMMASIGAPGIPSGSMAGMQMVLLAIGVPLEAIALLLMIERPLDTFRTAVNVEGDLVGCILISKYEAKK